MVACFEANFEVMKWYHSPRNAPSHLRENFVLTLAVTVWAFVLIGRLFSVVIAWVSLFVIYHWISSEHQISPEIVCILGGWLSSCFMRYNTDQRVVVAMTIQWAALRSISAGICYDIFHTSVCTIWFMLFTSVAVWFNRKRRHLPQGLAGTKFVSWRYLRSMASKMQPITRCQELPSTAFGDVGKAKYLVVVSHRWLDPRTSDVTTESCPLGIKLTALLQRLEETFWPSRILSWSALIVSSCDVVVFFDFMSLPQQGIDENDQVVPRTADEQRLFDRCLPYMGTLYSQFPVLVLSDVPEALDGYHPYQESGWCVCEFMIAALGNELATMSAESLGLLGRKSTVLMLAGDTVDVESARHLLVVAYRSLTRAKFTREADRAVTIRIIAKFLIKRLMRDAVKRGDVYSVKRLMSTMSVSDRLGILSEPLDRKLNTLLHFAVSSGHVDVCLVLLNCGAEPCLRNLFGDTPTRKYGLPRFGSAARTVRSFAKMGSLDNKCVGDVGVGTTEGLLTACKLPDLEKIFNEAETGMQRFARQGRRSSFFTELRLVAGD
eukprot:TRINITY_DN73959_c0_g1_i1.p1 TRINITY_DN73959_c0_g1~~TRINITY_DN73959_c0_g1_i1.p1  ORF type:complete len:645 (+),score=67.12 TRINITY_DN73959_c0_g1_i1:291-1937(+)